MSIFGLGIAALLALLLLVVVARPFFALPETAASFQDKQRERALAYYERVLSNIRDLDDDQATGKISPEEFSAEREIWLNRGVRLLAMLDELNAQSNIIENTQADAAEIDAAIEGKLSQAK